MFWPPCDAAILNVKQSPENPLVTALQPCMERPLQVKNSIQIQSQCTSPETLEAHSVGPLIFGAHENGSGA